MSALPASLLAALRSGLASGLNAQTLYRKTYAGNIGAGAVPFSAIVTRDDHVEDFTQETGERRKVHRITVRPLESITDVRLGDGVTYADVEFDVIAITGADIPTWVCEEKRNMGHQRADRFRREGRE